MGHNDGGPGGRQAGARGAAKLAHDELEEEQRGLGGLLVLGKVALDALLLLAAKGRVGKDDVHAVLLAELGELEAEGVARVDLRGVEAVEEEIHLPEQVGQRLGLAAVEGGLLQRAVLLHGLALGAQVLERFDQEAAGAGGGVEHALAEARMVALTMKRTTARGV